MEKFLAPHAEKAYALLRIVAGLMFSFHGMQKILGIANPGGASAVGSQLWIGGLIELVCGLAIAVGLFTRINAFLSSGTMAVAYIQFHWKFQFDDGFFPAINKGELALLYAFVFLYIACHGAGIWSADQARAKSS